MLYVRLFATQQHLLCSLTSKMHNSTCKVSRSLCNILWPVWKFETDYPLAESLARERHAICVRLPVLRIEVQASSDLEMTMDVASSHNDSERIKNAPMNKVLFRIKESSRRD